LCTQRRTDVGALRVRALVQSRTDIALGTANAGTHSASGCGRNVDRLPHATPHQALLEKDRQPCLLAFANQIAHSHSVIGVRAPLAVSIVYLRALLANSWSIPESHSYKRTGRNSDTYIYLYRKEGRGRRHKRHRAGCLDVGHLCS